MKSISSLITLTIIATVSAAPLTTFSKRQGGNCNIDGNILAPKVVGGNGGSPFCESSIGTTNQPITTMTFFNTAEAVIGAQATYADGTQSVVHGRQNDRNPQAITVNYTEGQSFHSTQLFAFPNGDVPRHIRMVSSTGEIMNVGESEPGISNVPATPQNVGNGTLIGFQGTTTPGGTLQSIGFLFQ